MARNGLVEPFVGLGFGWVEGNFDWVELGGIGIARGVFRTVVRVSRETSPPITIHYWIIIDGEIKTYIM